MEKRFTIARAAQIINVSTTTIKRWYKWYENPDFEKPFGFRLPEYTVNSCGTKLFTMSAVQELKDIKDKMSKEYRGSMAEFNAIYQWGQRGTKILQVGKQYKKKEELKK